MLRSIRRRSPRACAATIAGALALTAAGLSTGTAASAAPTSVAATLLAEAFKDAAAAGSMHQTITNVAGARRATFSDDVAGNSGIEDIVVSGGIRAHVRVTPQAAYVSGNPNGLAKYFGFPRSALSTIGDRWVSIASANAVYPALAHQATLSSVLAGLKPSGKLTELPDTTLDGQPVIAVRGALPASSQFKGTVTVYLTRASRPLPVLVRLVDGQSDGKASSTSVLSDWGERVVVTDPTGAIPIDRL